MNESISNTLAVGLKTREECEERLSSLISELASPFCELDELDQEAIRKVSETAANLIQAGELQCLVIQIGRESLEFWLDYYSEEGQKDDFDFSGVRLCSCDVDGLTIRFLVESAELTRGIIGQAGTEYLSYHFDFEIAQVTPVERVDEDKGNGPAPPDEEDEIEEVEEA